MDDVPTAAEAGIGGLRKVFVNDLEVVASIGVYEHEHRYLQRALVTLTLWVRDSYDGTSDSIRDVYDYDEAVRAVRETLDEGHTHLIETAAHRIASRCLENPDVAVVRVLIEKPDVLPGCRSVGIEIERRRPADG